MNATVVLVTKNRKDELRKALRSATSQSTRPEILVLDDGSTDGTGDMVHAEFTAVVLQRFAESKGCVVRRNEGARIAKGDIIFSIDDDAAFSTPDVVEQTLREFTEPRIGAVAIPYTEPHKGSGVLQRAPDQNGVWITDRFIGTAHAVRRDLFLELGGYREHLVHQGEESDYCIRMLDAGYFVRLGRSDPILHFESPRRDHRRVDYYGARNAVLFAWENVPWPPFLFHLLATTINVLRWTLEPARFSRRFLAILAGYGWCLTHWNSRRPVMWASYARARALRRAGSVII